MKFTTTALLTTLLSASALAAPSGGLARRTARRRSGVQHKSHPYVPAKNISSSLQGADKSNDEYSTNWVGAVLVGEGYTGVYGTFTVPTISLPAGGDEGSSYYASAWVGLDGYTCESAILQTGVDFNLEGGSVSFDAWYEWYPDYAYDFSGISFSEGDTVKLSIEASSTSSGTVTVENQSTGQSVSHSFSQESDELCETNAEWIVEDFSETEGGETTLVPLVDFGTVVFTDAYASTDSGSVGPSNAEIIDLIDSTGSTIIATASVVGDSEVVVKHDE